MIKVIYVWGKKASTELHHVNLARVSSHLPYAFHFPEIAAVNILAYILSYWYI